jgi:hypothetical protein
MVVSSEPEAREVKAGWKAMLLKVAWWDPSE